MEYFVSGNNRVDFTAYAPMHTFTGWAREGLEGVIDIDMEQVQLNKLSATANTLDFTTGDPERTKAMGEYFNFDQHPQSSFVMSECRSLTRQKSGILNAEIVGVLDFVGIRRQLPLQCMLTNHGNRIDFDLSFKWSFKAFGMKVPRLFFLTVRDIVDIRVHLEFFQNREEQ